MRYRVQIWIPVQAETGVNLRVAVDPPPMFTSVRDALRYINVYRSVWRSYLEPGEPRLIGVVQDDECRHVCGLGFAIEDTPPRRGRHYAGRLYTADQLEEFFLTRGTKIFPFAPSGLAANETHDMTDRNESEGRAA